MTADNPEFESRIDLSLLNNSVQKVREQIANIIVGQDQMIDQLLIALFSNGHVLLEGVPGIAKTLSVKLLAKCMNTGFSRIQFTPDLMPSDVVGTTIYNIAKSAFEFNRGPIFSNIILIDEINRAPAKTQSALFEVMEERQVTVDGTTYPMQAPFLVFATQNPIEQEGTYRLPEAQLDRFLFKISIDYPTLEQEQEILARHYQRRGNAQLDTVQPVLSPSEIYQAQQIVRQVQVDGSMQAYIAQLSVATRKHTSISLGASPRASLALMNSAQAWAAMEGRDFVLPDDIRKVIAPVLRHRIQLSPEKEMDGTSPDDIIREILHRIEVPR